MCLTTPYQIKKIKDKKAVAKGGKCSRTLDIRLLPKVRAGDWVLAENGFAVAKVSAQEVKQTLKLLNR